VHSSASGAATGPHSATSILHPNLCRPPRKDCDEYNAVLTRLRSFILPGRITVAAHLHMAHTMARRAQRSTWSAPDEHGTRDFPKVTVPPLDPNNRKKAR
jgi:cob(I)alamin adenosyltransferase